MHEKKVEDMRSQSSNVVEQIAMGSESGQSMVLLRDLLCGPLIREFNYKISELKKVFESTLETWRREMEANLTMVHSQTVRDLKVLEQRISSQEELRYDTLAKVRAELAKTTERLEQMTIAVQKSFHEANSEMIEAIRIQGAENREIAQRESLKASLIVERSKKDLETQGLNRDSLSSLFIEVAEKLRTEGITKPI